MIIAIHHRPNSFSEEWINYCKVNEISFKLVNCYANDIMEQLKDCDVFLWHWHHSNPKDVLFARQLIYSIELTKKKVFPNSKTVWHFDDKVGQKYLLEAINAPLIPSYVFYSKKEAKSWLKTTSYPKVFKLRSGAGSYNVKLINSYEEALKIVKKAFDKGFKRSSFIFQLKEYCMKYFSGKIKARDFQKKLVGFFYSTNSKLLNGKEKNYVYFQDFIPENNSDIRVNVIGNRAFAIKRYVRKNDFRASGSDNFEVLDKNNIDLECLRIAFKTSKKLKAQCLAYDFAYFEGKPMILEISYGFSTIDYDICKGYWDENLNFIEGKVEPQNWMISDLINLG